MNKFIKIGFGLLLVAVLLIIYNTKENKKATKNAVQTLSAFKEVLKETKINGDSITIDTYDVLGYLSFENFDYELPIMAKADDYHLNVSPSREYGSIENNDLVIAGHNYQGHFRLLWQLKEDDILIFTDTNNVSVIYEVQLHTTLYPSQSEEVVHSPYDLILYTCTYGAKERVIIGANRIKQ